MTAGIPGAGIGGLFYLVSSLALPVRSLWRRLRGRPDPVSLRQLGLNLTMALGIIVGLWFAGWVLAFIVPTEMLMRAPAPGAAASTGMSRTVIPAATLAAGVATLGAVLLSVEVARFAVRRRRAEDRAAGPAPAA